ncbi:MAG: type II secretion system protein GspM [Telluria sp.]
MKTPRAIGQLRERAAVWWLARTEKERNYLTVGGAIVFVTLLWAILIDPAMTGRAELRRQLPQLRQQAAELQSMALEAAQLAARPVPTPAVMTRETLAASLATRSINPLSLAMTGEYAKLQVSNVSFANLVTWLDAQRRENRIVVQDLTVSALAAPGQVDATLTLHQATGAAAR